MNVYLKTAVQSLDCEINRLTGIRNQLLNGADTSAAPILEPMRANQPPAVPLGADVQTRGLRKRPWGERRTSNAERRTSK